MNPFDEEKVLAEAQALDEAYASATGPAEAYEKDVLAMLDALKVITTTQATLAWLQANDPKALAQALKAIEDFEPWLEEPGDDPRANGWVDDRGRP